MREFWKWYLPGYILCLPGTLIGVLLALAYYHPKEIKFRDGCIECISRRTIIGGKWVGAQTWGHVIFYRDARMQSWDELSVHERTHVVQAMVLSYPLYALLYGLHYVLLYGFGGLSWKAAYREVWAERHAYSVQEKFSYDLLKFKVWGDR